MEGGAEQELRAAVAYCGCWPAAAAACIVGGRRRSNRPFTEAGHRVLGGLAYGLIVASVDLVQACFADHR